jgi:sigma-B regulation protein RsbU (phosphoserine phosphatase)
MKVQGKVKGILVIGNKLTGESFSEENLLFIEALGNIAISALENERLFKQEIEKKRLDNELTMALEIQKKLLPKEIPVIPGYNIAAISIPSRYVGGDYYDIIKLPDGNIIIAIADVSGKGMPAALIMANVQAALRILSNLSTDIADIILQINNIVYQNTSEDKFITFFCGIINPSKQTFRYINAGHNPPILINKENVVYNLDKGGLILGFMEKPFEYQSEVINLNSGDIVFFYTDGVTEAQNQQSEELGIEASVNIILKNKEKTVNNLLDAILANVFNLSKNGTEHDDITCILLKVE